MKKDNRGSGIVLNVFLGILMLPALGLLVLLNAGPVRGEKPGSVGGGISVVEAFAVAETAEPRDEQLPVTFYSAEGAAYHITSDGTRQPAGVSREEPLTGIGEVRSTQTDTSAVLADDEDYILPECSIRFYSREELEALSGQQLYYARNEIYARLGRKFKSEELNQYFSRKSWYAPRFEPSEFDGKGDSLFNPYELANRNLIVSIEEERKGG